MSPALGTEGDAFGSASDVGETGESHTLPMSLVIEGLRSPRTEAQEIQSLRTQRDCAIAF